MQCACKRRSDDDKQASKQASGRPSKREGCRCQAAAWVAVAGPDEGTQRKPQNGRCERTAAQCGSGVDGRAAPVSAMQMQPRMQVGVNGRAGGSVCACARSLCDAAQGLKQRVSGMDEAGEGRQPAGHMSGGVGAAGHRGGRHHHDGRQWRMREGGGTGGGAGWGVGRPQVTSGTRAARRALARSTRRAC